MRDIDAVIRALTEMHPGIVHEQLKVLHPGADDDGLWFFSHPDGPYEVRLESPAGQCPFLFETNAHDARATATTVVDGLGLGASDA